MKKVFLVAMVLMVAVCLAGCPKTGAPRKAEALTIGGDPVSGYLQNGDENWYSFEIEEASVGKDMDIVLRNVNPGVSVGVTMTLFSEVLNEKGKPAGLAIEWQEIVQPGQYVQMTDENTVPTTKSAEKAAQMQQFVIPRKGVYYISVEGFQLIEGRRPANSYQYRDTLAYTLAARFTPKPGVSDAATLSAQPQAANVPFTTVILRKGETAFHPMTLSKETWYQVQIDTDGGINWAITDDQGTASASSSFFTVARDGNYFLQVEAPFGGGSDFGYVEYRVRLYQDDHGQDADSATKIEPKDGAYGGYLTKGDMSDWFSVVFPKNEGTDPVAYTLEISLGTDALLLTAPGLGSLPYDSVKAVYTLTFTQWPGADEQETLLYVSEPIPSDITEGFGAYTLSVKKI